MRKAWYGERSQWSFSALSQGATLLAPPHLLNVEALKTLPFGFLWRFHYIGIWLSKSLAVGD